VIAFADEYRERGVVEQRAVVGLAIAQGAQRMTEEESHGQYERGECPRHHERRHRALAPRGEDRIERPGRGDEGRELAQAREAEHHARAVDRRVRLHGSRVPAVRQITPDFL
jgi:hypothetical protein